MKEKLFKGLLIVFAIMVVLLPLSRTRADSGWDSSYSSSGGGSSYLGGSSYSGGSSYHSYSSSSSYGSSFDGDFDLSFFIAIIFVTVLIIIITSKKAPSYDTSNRYEIRLMTQEEVNAIDSSINIDEFMKQSFDLFVKIQEAWENFKYDELRELLSDELFNNYKMQLETLELESGKNIMDDYTYVDGGIISINKTDLTEEVKIKLHVRMKDYVIDTTDNSIKHGDPAKIMDNNYIITLERSIRSEITNCPNCGAELKDTASQVCPYCDAVLVKGSKDFVMVKKENVKGQYR